MQLQNQLQLTISPTEQVQLITEVRVLEVLQEVTEHHLQQNQATLQALQEVVVALQEVADHLIQAEVPVDREAREVLLVQGVLVVQEVLVAPEVQADHVLHQEDDNIKYSDKKHHLLAM